MKHVVDADASQSVAVEEVARGSHLVVKGPPGTGKSQTITNIIAAAVADGRRVLFVAEKMAALEVVYRRLRDVGLGPLILELHSSKANRRAVLEELRRTKETPWRPVGSDESVIDRLTQARDDLNRHAGRMHRPHRPSGLTPYQLIGHLLRIRTERGVPGLDLDGPETWTPAEFTRSLEACREMAQRLGTIGEPIRHPWYGVRRDAVDPSELEIVLGAVERLHRDPNGLARAHDEAVGLLGLEGQPCLSDFDRVYDVLGAIAALPACDLRALGGPVWLEGADRAAQLVQSGLRMTALRDAVDASFAEQAWQSSLSSCRSVLAAKGGSLLRLLSGAYRENVARLRSHLRVPLPKTLSERLALLDGLPAAQEAQRRFKEVKPDGARAFGALWRNEPSNWEAMQALVDWRRWSGAVIAAPVLARLSGLTSLDDLLRLHEEFEESLPRFRRDLDTLIDFLALDIPGALDVETIGDASSLAALFEAWIEAPEAITGWIAFYDRCRTIGELGMPGTAQAVIEGRLEAESIVPTLERSYFEAMRTEIFIQNPELKRFDGALHNRLVDGFKALDGARMSLARERIAARHGASLPRSGGGIGPLGVLNGELAKKRNHLPIRRLLDRAGPAIQQMKPIFMMSPLSVAQFLKPGTLSFDLLVMDEASRPL